MDFINSIDWGVDRENKNSILWNSDETKATIYEENFTYYIDIEKGVVAAVMNHPRIEAGHSLDKTLAPFLIKSDILGRYGVTSHLEKYFSTPIRAKATCADEDEFDLEVGKKIARERCLAKYYRRLVQMFVDLSNQFDEALDIMDEALCKYAKCYNKYISD